MSFLRLSSPKWSLIDWKHKEAVRMDSQGQASSLPLQPMASHLQKQSSRFRKTQSQSSQGLKRICLSDKRIHWRFSHLCHPFVPLLSQNQNHQPIQLSPNGQNVRKQLLLIGFRTFFLRRASVSSIFCSTPWTDQWQQWQWRDSIDADHTKRGRVKVPSMSNKTIVSERLIVSIGYRTAPWFLGFCQPPMTVWLWSCG